MGWRMHAGDRGDVALLREAADLVCAAAPAALPATGLPREAGAWRLHRGGRSDVLAVRLADGTALAAKFYHDDRLIARIRSRTGLGKWHAAFRASVELTARGVPHTRAWGWAEGDGRGLLFMEYLDGHASVRDALRAGWLTADADLAARIGVFTGRLHALGVVHDDFSLRNILCDRWRRLALADLEDVSFPLDRALAELCEANLYHLDDQLPEELDRRLRRVFLQAYRRTRIEAVRQEAS